MQITEYIIERLIHSGLDRDREFLISFSQQELFVHIFKYRNKVVLSVLFRILHIYIYI